MAISLAGLLTEGLSSVVGELAVWTLTISLADLLLECLSSVVGELSA